MHRSITAIGLITALVLPSSLAAQVRKADLIVRNGHVYAGREEATNTAIAIRGNLIIAVGKDADMAGLRSSSTKDMDAKGGWILPGFEDDHLHLLQGALSLAQPDVRTAADVAAIQAIVRVAAERNPTGWLQAGGWLPAQFPDGAPTRQMLDAVIADRPVVLWSLDRHGAWANSKALALAGITAERADPPMGEFVRDAAGVPTGWIKEASAIAILTKAIPEPTPDEHKQLLKLAMAEANRNGITALTHAALGGGIDEFNLLKAMDAEGVLTTRINYALGVGPDFTDKDFSTYQNLWRANPATPRLKMGSVKFFLDGVPQAHTAFLLAPWGEQHEEGHPLMERAQFHTWATAFDAAGWQLMMHAMGDGAVRMALDEVAGLPASNAPARGRRHRIEHAFLIDPADMPRFAQLNVVANFQPVNAFPPSAPSTKPIERPARDGARWAGLDARGAHISFGSDWPVFPMDPLGRIYAMTMGREDQRMDPLAIIDNYTRGTAYATFDDDRLGTIAIGKLADVVILKKYLGRTLPESRADLQVAATIFDGELVYTSQ